MADNKPHSQTRRWSCRISERRTCRQKPHAPTRTRQRHTRPPKPALSTARGTLSFPADIWSLACTLWEVLSHRPLFEPWAATDDDILADQVDLLGRLPEEWRDAWDARWDYFTEDGELDTTAPSRWHDSTRDGWGGCFAPCIRLPRQRDGQEAMSEREEEALLAMLKPMLVFRPEERVSAADVLRPAWVQEWAAPDLEMARKHWQGR